MFIAQSTTQITLRRSAMFSAKVINCGFWYNLEQKSAVDPLHGTPSERNRAGPSAINITLLRSEEMTFARSSKASLTIFT
jgi:hypothetical protein